MIEPEKYLQEIADVVICPTCLAEKHIGNTVTLEYEGQAVHFLQMPRLLDGLPA